MNFTPFSRQAFSSFSKIGREALEMSVSPLQNFLNPPPVPETATVTRFPELFWKSEAALSVKG